MQYIGNYPVVRVSGYTFSSLVRGHCYINDSGEIFVYVGYGTVCVLDDVDVPGYKGQGYVYIKLASIDDTNVFFMHSIIENFEQNVQRNCTNKFLIYGETLFVTQDVKHVFKYTFFEDDYIISDNTLWGISEVSCDYIDTIRTDYVMRDETVSYVFLRIERLQKDRMYLVSFVDKCDNLISFKGVGVYLRAFYETLSFDKLIKRCMVECKKYVDIHNNLITNKGQQVISVFNYIQLENN